MRIEALQQEVRTLMQGIEHPRVGAALALAEECGEVMRWVLEREVYGGKEKSLLAEEVGDVLLALAEICDRYELSLEACATDAVAKLRRKAPEWREALGGSLEDVRRRMDGGSSE